MSAPRNFRKILDLDPDSPGFHCVGVTKKGERCKVSTQFIGYARISRASALLTEMDSQPLKQSYRYLEELASNTLCRWHSKPGYSQVGAVTLIWTKKIQQLEREEARIAKALVVKQTVTRKTAGAQNATIEVTIIEASSKLQSSERSRSSKTVKAADLMDPFVTRSSTEHTSVPETPFTQRLKKSRAAASEASSHNVSLHSSISHETELDSTNNSPTTSSRIASLPSPPDTPLVQRQRAPQDTEEGETRQPVLISEQEAITPGPEEVSKPLDFVHKFGSTPSTETEFRFQPTTVPSCWPETPKDTPQPHRQRREAFHLALPDTPVKISKDMSDACAAETKEASTDHVDNMVEDVLAAQNGDLVEAGNDGTTSAAASDTPGEEPATIDVGQAPQGDELPQTPTQGPGDENFGYAVITSSTRSRSYLPAKQRYGLMTPPDEPNILGEIAAKSNTPVVGNDLDITPLPALPQEKSFRIPRKPLSPSADSPSLNLPVQQGVTTGRGGSNKGATGTPVYIRSTSIIDSSPTATTDNEDVRAGCFGGHYVRRVKEKVVEKVREVKQRRMWANVKFPTTSDE